jgi:5-formyltetrahydrofolate cyclo-ligase
MMSKSVLRATMLARRRLLTAAEQAAYGRAIQKTLLGLHAYEQASSLALYLPVNGEVPTAEIMNHAHDAGKSIYLPVIDGEKIYLRQYSRFDRLKPGRFGILEPPECGLTVQPQHIDLFVVPGVVFDLVGNRGGYGKGYYDRLLHACCDKSLLLGVCYDFQVVENIEFEPHDVRMDMVITERRVISSYC